MTLKSFLSLPVILIPPASKVQEVLSVVKLTMLFPLKYKSVADGTHPSQVPVTPRMILFKKAKYDNSIRIYRNLRNIHLIAAIHHEQKDIILLLYMKRNLYLNLEYKSYLLLAINYSMLQNQFYLWKYHLVFYVLLISDIVCRQSSPKK